VAILLNLVLLNPTRIYCVLYEKWYKTITVQCLLNYSW